MMPRRRASCECAAASAFQLPSCCAAAAVAMGPAPKPCRLRHSCRRHAYQPVCVVPLTRPTQYCRMPQQDHAAT